MMDFKFILFILLFASVDCTYSTSWNTLNCPAPRAPENGLSFIFRNGEVVHFRCHPGYIMKGKPIAYCVNQAWTEPAPECVTIKRWSVETNLAYDPYRYHRTFNPGSGPSQADKHRQLFNWAENDVEQSKPGVYGDGPRRLPLINGIWPSQDQKEQVLSLGPQSTPGPKTMVKEEIDIAELRNKQLEDVKSQRNRKNRGHGKKRGHRNKNKKHHAEVIDDTETRETVLSVGNTEDGQALSVAFARPQNETERKQHRHKHRHRGGKRRHHGRRRQKGAHSNENGFIISRASRVDTSGIAPYHTKYQFNLPGYEDIEELRRRPVEQVHKYNASEFPDLHEFDTTCIEPIYGRDVPMLAPDVRNAFVFRYETRKNKRHPFNSYMLVKYRCLSGFVFANPKAQTLHCKTATWVGEIPRCVNIN